MEPYYRSLLDPFKESFKEPYSNESRMDRIEKRLERRFQHVAQATPAAFSPILLQATERRRMWPLNPKP